MSANPTFPIVVRTPEGDEYTLTSDVTSGGVQLVDVYGNPIVLAVGQDRLRLRDGSDILVTLVGP